MRLLRSPSVYFTSIEPIALTTIPPRRGAEVWQRLHVPALSALAVGLASEVLSMLRAVGGFIREQLQILESVIQSFSVLVMHTLLWSKRSSKCDGHQIAMFEHAAASNSNRLISLACNTTFPVGVLHACQWVTMAAPPSIASGTEATPMIAWPITASCAWRIVSSAWRSHCTQWFLNRKDGILLLCLR